MSDIVERLQAAMHEESALYAPRTSRAIEAMREAKAEIERLGNLATIVREQGFEIEQLRERLRVVLLHVAELRTENERMETK